jgi:DNA-binding response OmpR family regulator
MPQYTVLVVDDDPSILDFLDVALTEQGYRVLTAVDGDALRLAQLCRPNVILLDLQMPVMDGAEISRHLRADAATAHIPIIVMSAKDRLDTTVRTMSVDDQLAKPFPLRVLYDVVARWC